MQEKQSANDTQRRVDEIITLTDKLLEHKRITPTGKQRNFCRFTSK